MSRIRRSPRREPAADHAGLVESLPLPVLVHVGDRIVYANPAAADLFAAKHPSDLVGRSPIDLVHPDSRAFVAAWVRKVMHGGRTAERSEERLLRFDGRPIDAEVIGQPIQYGGREAVQVTIRDITERKYAEAAIRTSQEQLSEAQRLSHLGSWEVDLRDLENPRGDLHWSDEVFRIFGYEPRAVPATNESFWRALDPDDRARFREVIAAAIRDRQPYELQHRIVLPDGRERVVHERSRIFYDETGQPTRMVGTVQDVTEGERVKRAIETSERKFRTLFDSSVDSMTLHSLPDGRYLDVNRGFESLFGFTKQEAIGRTAVEIGVWDRSEALQAALRKLATEGVVQDRELQLRTKEGREMWALFSATRLDLDDGPVILASARDITERRRAAEELALARDAALESNRLKSAFLANVSHEIRTPLNVVLGLTEFVSTHLEDLGDHSQDDNFRRIDRASQRLLTTIDSILDLSKLETGTFDLRPRPVDLFALVGELLETYRPRAQARGLTLRSTFEVAVATIVFDEYCLRQSLANLLDNAVKFTVKGSITVHVGRDDDGALVLKVSDTGIGIDEKFQPRLFEPFTQEDAGYTRHFEGSGLGLALARRYLEKNGATIDLESRKGSGSVFRIRFADRAAPSDPSSGATKDRKSLSEQEKPLVLVVEDDTDTQGYMAALLGRSYTVRLAANGDECRREVALAGPRLRLVLMDLSLSGPEDGLGLTRQLREQETTKALPIIAVTAHAMSKDRENALRAGCDEYISKPIDRAELFAKIDRLLLKSAS